MQSGTHEEAMWRAGEFRRLAEQTANARIRERLLKIAASREADAHGTAHAHDMAYGAARPPAKVV